MRITPTFQRARAAGLAAAAEAFNEFTIIAPPGTGKTTTLVQVADAINAARRSAALLIPLGEWSSQDQSFLASVAAAAACGQPIPGYGGCVRSDHPTPTGRPSVPQ